MSSELRIREIRSSDIERLVQLGRRLFAREDQVFGLSDETLRKEIRDYRLARMIGKLIGTHDREFFVGEVDGVPIGTAMVNRISDAAWYISSVMVDPDYQRRGYAKRLLEQACAEVRKFGGQRAILHVASDNEGAKLLYASAGFKEFEREIFYARENGNVVPEPFPSGYSVGKIDRFDKRAVAFIDACREPTSAAIYGTTIQPHPLLRALWRLSYGAKFERAVVSLGGSWVAAYSVFAPSAKESARVRVSLMQNHLGLLERAIVTQALKRSHEFGSPKTVISLLSKREELAKVCTELGFQKVFETDGMVKTLAGGDS